MNTPLLTLIWLGIIAVPLSILLQYLDMRARSRRGRAQIRLLQRVLDAVVSVGTEVEIAREKLADQVADVYVAVVDANDDLCATLSDLPLAELHDRAQQLAKQAGGASS